MIQTSVKAPLTECMTTWTYDWVIIHAKINSAVIDINLKNSVEQNEML